MTTPGAPATDSALDAVTDAFRVLGRPGFLWLPILLTTITSLPLLAVPRSSELASTITTRAELDSTIQAFLLVFALTTAIGLVLGPVVVAVTYRLGAEYIDREAPNPIGPGFVGLAWRFFLQELSLLLLTVVGLLCLLLSFAALQIVLGFILAAIVVAVGGGILFVGVAARLAPAPVLLLSGEGPIRSLERSWRMTRGHWGQVIRWLVATGVTVGIVGVIVNLAVGGLLEALTLGGLQPVVSAAIGAPFSLIAAIVYVRLTRVLTDGREPTRPEPAGDALPA